MHIGLFFGSFNPIHIGHLAIASYIAQFTELSQVWFVVSPHNPLKEKQTLLKEYHRLAMVNAALENIPYLKATDIEFGLPQPSYTVNTLAHLEEKYPQHTFSLILGSDNLTNFHKWKNHEVIIERYKLLVYPRPEVALTVWHTHPNVQLINAPRMDISSTFIRNVIKQGKDAQCFMPSKSWEYLDDMNFYK
jgi:nicotinate-nucleotide adenylyltransferase